MTPNNCDKYEKPSNVQNTQKEVNKLRNKIRDLGSINIDAIEEYKKESIRHHVAYVPQEHVLFSRSVLDNVAMGKDNPTKEEIDLATKLCTDKYNTDKWTRLF